MMSAALVASATVITSNPSFSATGQDLPPRRRPTFIVKDVRLFLNTIRRSMGIMQRAGVDAACEREDTDEEIRLTIRIPRTGAAKTA